MTAPMRKEIRIPVMIDWILAHQLSIVRFSRWIVVACALGLLGISQLEPGPLNRAVAIVGLAAISLVFMVWLAIVLITIIRPRFFDDLRRRRS